MQVENSRAQKRNMSIRYAIECTTRRKQQKETSRDKKESLLGHDKGEGKL